MASQDGNDGEAKEYRRDPKLLIKVFVTLLIMWLACVAYLSLYKNGLNHTALMFVGLPTKLVLALAQLVSSDDAVICQKEKQTLVRAIPLRGRGTNIFFVRKRDRCFYMY